MTFQEWQEIAKRIGDRAKVAQNMAHDRGWKLAASVGIPRDGCCLHNAAIDTELSGWCKDNPQRLKVAKQADHILKDWSISNLADRIVHRAYAKVQF